MMAGYLSSGRENKRDQSTKLQIPNPKKIPNSKSQEPALKLFEIWVFGFYLLAIYRSWELGFGIGTCCSGARCLELRGCTCAPPCSAFKFDRNQQSGLSCPLLD